MNTEQKRALLARFCAKQDIRYYLEKPIRQDGHLYATNGHILVRIEDDPATEARTACVKDDQGHAPPNCAALLKTLVAEWFLPIDVSALPEPGACKACSGSGAVLECPDCDGKGEFEHGNWNYDCKECDGAGVVKRSAFSGRKVPCGDCDGTGKDDHIKVELRGAGFQLRYLKLMAELPGVELSVNPNDPRTTHYFRFDGGVGAVMPCWRD